MSTIDFPYIEFYMSDYIQLGFIFEKKCFSINGYNFQDSGGVNYIGLNLSCVASLEPEKIKEWLIEVWWHEYCHLIGFSEEQIKYFNMGVNTINVEL